jgi:ComF family protein
MNIPLVPLLVKTKNTTQQHFLQKNMRIKNLRNSFKIIHRKELVNKNILLIDDVFTTGNTLNECAQMLLKNGAKRIYGFTLARGI